MWYVSEYQHCSRNEYIDPIKKLLQDWKKAPAAMFMLVLSVLWALA